jgi:hypothetical protein
MPPPARYTPKYQPLVDWLQALPADQQNARLSFAEIEALIGERLPVSARTTGTFWIGHRMAEQNWRRVGFRARVDRHDATAVTFTRVER